MKKTWKISGLALVTVILVSLVASCKVQTFSCKQIHKEDIEEFANDTTERFLFDWSGEQKNTILDISHVNAHATKCPKVHFSIEGDTLFVTENIRKSANKKASWKYSIPIGDKTYLVVKTDAKQVFPIMKTEEQKSFQVFATRAMRGDGKDSINDNILGKWYLKEEYDEKGLVCRVGNDAYWPNGDPVLPWKTLPVEKLYVNKDLTWQYLVDDIIVDCGIVTTISLYNLKVCKRYYDMDIDVLAREDGTFYDAMKAKKFTSHTGEEYIGYFFNNSIPYAIFYGHNNTHKIIFYIIEGLHTEPYYQDVCLPRQGKMKIWYRLLKN